MTMITGDNQLTACSVARDLRIIRVPVNEVLTFHNADEGRKGKEGKEGREGKERTKEAEGGAAGAEWGLLLPGAGGRGGNGVNGVSMSMETVLQTLASVKLGHRGDREDRSRSDWDLCLTGASMDLIAEWAKGARHNYEEVLSKICPHVRVFARVTPQQKEAVLLALKTAGLGTLMCGDGTFFWKYDIS